MDEIELKYFIELPNDGTHDQGVTLKLKEEATQVYNIVLNPDDKRFFQRIKVYANNFVVSEEVWSDYRILRFNQPFKQEGDTLYFDI